MQANMKERRVREIHARRGDQLDGWLMHDWARSIDWNRGLGETISAPDQLRLAFQGLYGDDRPGHVFP